MSSEIIIFQAPDEIDEIVKDHRELEEEKLTNDLGPENFIHVEFMLDMETNISSNYSFWIKSNIQSIIAKQLLLYCDPIVKEIPTDHMNELKDFYIQVQLNYDVHAFIHDTMVKIKIPAEMPFRLVGFKSRRLLLPHLEYSTISSTHPILTDLKQLFLSGSYSYELTKKNINVGLAQGPFTQQLYPVLTDDYSVIPKFKNMRHLLANKDDAKNTMDAMHRKILLAKEYYSKFLPFFMLLKIPKKIEAPFNVYKTENKIPTELKDVLYYPYINENGFNEKLVGEGILVLYNYMKKLGINDQTVQSLIKHKQTQNHIKRTRIAQDKDLSMQIVDDFRKQAIVNRKFPGKTYKELVQKEKEVVLREFELLNKKAKFIRDKTIRSAIRAFLNSFELVDTEKNLLSSYEKIQNILKEKGIKPNDIGLCDHHMRRAEITLGMFKDKTIYRSRSAYDIRELIIKEFTTTDTLIDDEYYCKICGEQVAEDTTAVVEQFSGNQKLNTGSEVDALEELVYRDVTYIIRTYVRFKNLVDIRPIIKSIVASITPEMHVIETKLKQIQTNISDDMRDLIGMYIYIYTFALVSHMIYVNYGQITFAFREGAFGGNPEGVMEDNPYIVQGGESSDESAKDRLQNILKNALYLIISTKVKLLKASNNIGPDKVKPILLQAYQWVLKLQTFKNVTKSENDIDFEIINSITTSSIYQYLLTTQQVLHPKIKETDLKSVIGVGVDVIKAENYKSKKEKINPFKSAPVIEEQSWKKTGNKYYDQYTYGSYLQSINYEKREVYKDFVTPPSDRLLKHYENAKQLLDIEKRLKFQSRFTVYNPLNVIKRTFHYPVAQKVKYNIGKYYRPDGSKRVWNKLVLSNDAEVNLEELRKIDFETRKTLHVKDLKDGNDYLSKIKDYSSSIIKKFEQQDYTKSLLEYFENRCPIEGIHEFKDSNVCTKCSRDMSLAWIYSDEVGKYVAQHSAQFDKQNKLKLSLVKNGIENIKKLNKPQEFKKTEYPKWDISEVQVLEWSRMFPKFNINMLLNLGCSEHRKYLLIEKERDNPVKTYKNEDHQGRISKLDAYYNSVVRDYYLIKNFQYIDVLPLNYKDYIEKYKNDIPKFPNLEDNEYSKKLEWYRVQYKDSNAVVCNFILIQIANIILQTAKLNEAGKALAEQLTLSLIQKERLLSKPDPFKLVIDKRTKNDEYQSDTSSEGSEIDDDVNVDTPEMSEAGSDIDDQNQETEAYSFGLEETAIDDLNDGNDDDDESNSDQE